MSDRIVSIMMIMEVVVAITMIVTILLQSGDEGLGGGFLGGGGGESFRSKRGLEKFLYRATIFLAVVFATLSFLIVKYTN